LPQEDQKDEEPQIKIQGPLVLDKANNFVYEQFNQQFTKDEKLE